VVDLTRDNLQDEKTRWLRYTECPPTERVLRDTLRTSHGVPPSARPAVWIRFSGTTLQPGLYKKLLSAPERQTGEHAQIEVDISRSGCPEEDQQASLRNVLRAYSLFAPATGYTQGQNFIAAGLLRHVPEEEAFWLLGTIVETYLPDHFTDHMVGSLVDCMVLQDLLSRRMPDIAAKLDSLEVSVQLLATRWYLSFWASVLSPTTLGRVYDVVFALGPHSVHLVALACFHHLRPRIVAATNADELTVSSIMQPLRDVPTDDFLRTLLCHVGDLKPPHLERLRTRMRLSLIAPQAATTPSSTSRRLSSLGSSLQNEFRKITSRGGRPRAASLSSLEPLLGRVPLGGLTMATPNRLTSAGCPAIDKARTVQSDAESERLLAATPRPRAVSAPVAPYVPPAPPAPVRSSTRNPLPPLPIPEEIPEEAVEMERSAAEDAAEDRWYRVQGAAEDAAEDVIVPWSGRRRRSYPPLGPRSPLAASLLDQAATPEQRRLVADPVLQTVLALMVAAYSATSRLLRPHLVMRAGRATQTVRLASPRLLLSSTDVAAMYSPRRTKNDSLSFGTASGWAKARPWRLAQPTFSAPHGGMHAPKAVVSPPLNWLVMPFRPRWTPEPQLLGASRVGYQGWP